MRIALQKQERVLDPERRFGEHHLGASLRRHEHAGRHDIETAGLHTGNERSPFGRAGIRDAAPHSLQNDAQDLDVGACQGAGVIHVGIRLEVVEGDVQPPAGRLVYQPLGLCGNE